MRSPSSVAYKSTTTDVEIKAYLTPERSASPSVTGVDCRSIWYTSELHFHGPSPPRYSMPRSRLYGLSQCGSTLAKLHNVRSALVEPRTDSCATLLRIKWFARAIKTPTVTRGFRTGCRWPALQFTKSKAQQTHGLNNPLLQNATQHFHVTITEAFSFCTTSSKPASPPS